MAMDSDEGRVDGSGGGGEEESGGDAESVESLTDEQIIEATGRMMAMSQGELQRMNVDPVSFAMNMIGIQVKVLIRELWPEQRDQLLFDHKVAMELEKAVEEMASEVRKQQLIQGVGMTPPNRAARRREERGR